MAAYDSDVQLSVGLDPENVISTAEKLNEDLESIFNQRRSGQTSTSFKNLQIQMDRLIQRSQDLQAQIEQLQSHHTVTPVYEEYQKAIDKLGQQYSKLEERQQRFLELGGKENSKQFQTMAYDIEQVRYKMDNLRDEMRQLRQDGNAFQLGSDTEQYNELIRDLNEVNNQMVVTRQKAQDVDNIELGGIRGAFQKLLPVIVNVAKTILSINVRAIKAGFSALAKVLQKVAVSAKNAASNIAKIAGKAVISGIKKVTSAIGSLNKSGNKNKDVFGKALRNVLRYGFGIRSVYMLVRKLRTALIKGFEELAKVNDPFNQSMSEMLTALTYLRNAFAAAFAPIIETVSPIITQFINKVAEAVSQVGMLIAALTGKEFILAVPVYQDYAESAGNTADNSKKAADSMNKENKAAKELKRTLAGFDDVEILHENHDTDTSSGLDSGQTTSPSGFTTAPISASITDFMRKLVDAWKNADFYEIGRIVGNKLKDALEKIPWNAIKEVLRKIAKSIATFLNGFLETPGLFDTIGKTIAEAINSAFEFVESFVSNFHWDSLGNAIKEGLLGVINNLDWNLIFNTVKELGAGIGTALDSAFNNPEIWEGILTTLSNALNAIIYGLDSFLTNIDFGSLGENIGRGLNNGIETFDWDALAQLLIDLINGVFDLWYNFVNTFDFYKFGNHIGKALSDVINGIDWVRGGLSLAKTINGLFNALNGFIKGMNWKELGLSIMEFIVSALHNINWNLIYETAYNLGSGIGTAIQASLNNPGIWSDIFKTVGNSLNTIIYAIQGFLQQVNWSQLGQNIADGLNKGFDSIDWAALAQTLKMAINDLFDLWYSFVTTFDFRKFGNYIGTALSYAIKEIDWAKGGASVAETINGLYTTLLGFVESVDWKAVGKSIVDAIAGYFGAVDWKTAGATLSACLVALLNTLTGIVQEVNWLELVSSITKAIGEYFAGFDWSAIASSTMELLGSALAAAILSVAGIAKAIGEWIAGGLLGAKDYFAEQVEACGGNVAKGILKGIGGIFVSIGTWIVNNIFKPFIEGIKSVFGISSPATEMVPFGEWISKGLLEGIASVFTSIVNWLKENIVEPITSGIKSLFGLDGEEPLLFKIGSSVIGTFKDGIASAGEKLNEFVNEKIVKPVTEGFDNLITDVGEKLAESDVFGVQAMAEALPITQNYTDSLDKLGTVAQETSDKAAWNQLKTALANLNDNGVLADDAFTRLSNSMTQMEGYGVPFQSVIDNITESLRNEGVMADDLNTILGNTPDATSQAVDGLKDLADSSDITKDKTGGVSDVLKGFDELSILTPLKLWLIEQAIGGLGDKGEISQDKVGELQNILDNYDTSNPQSKLEDMGTSFEELGISAESFGTALVEAASKTDEDMGRELNEIISTINNTGDEIETKGSELGGNLGKGLVNGIQSQQGEVGNSSKTLINTYVLNAVDEAADSHSPSMEMYKRGAFLVQGLLNGAQSLEGSVADEFRNFMYSVLSTIDSFQSYFAESAMQLIYEFESGLSVGAGNIDNTIYSILNGISNAFYSIDWFSIGNNIGIGIYNGFQSMSGELEILAWNTAVSMYNSACRALNIASPSKKFAWIGEMTMAGLENGIEDNSDPVIGTISDVVDGMEKEAKNAKPVIDLGVNIGDVLDNFSDVIVTEFDKLITSLQTLANFSTNMIPGIAQGKVIPYASGLSQDRYDTANEELLNTLDYINAHQITVEELQSIIESAVRQLNFDFYIGDEQVARHANAGNMKLDRRYNI